MASEISQSSEAALGKEGLSGTPGFGQASGRVTKQARSPSGRQSPTRRGKHGKRLRFTDQHNIFGRYDRRIIGNEPGWIYPDLLQIPEIDQSAEELGFSCNGYALLRDNKLVLVDVTSNGAVSHVENLLNTMNLEVVGLVLTHFHPVTKDLPRVVSTLNVPVYLNPHDHDHDIVKRLKEQEDIEFHNPFHSSVLKDFGLSFEDFPGHTRGSILIRWQRADIVDVKEHAQQSSQGSFLGDVLFVGDTAIGSGMKELHKGNDYLMRAPVVFNEDDTCMRHHWQKWLKSDRPWTPRPICCVACYHGQVFPRVIMAQQVPQSERENVQLWSDITKPLTRLELTHEW